MQKMVSFALNDYVIVADGNKKQLVKIVKVSKDEILVIPEALRSEDHKEYKPIDPNNIIANLGANPKSGSVYGNNVEIFRKTIEVDYWGEVKLFLYLKKDELKIFKKALKHCALALEKLKIELDEFTTEIREPKGKWSGMYRYRSKKADVMQLRPKDFEDLEYLIFHELGHAIWYRKTSDKTKARWILQYQKAIILNKVSPQHIKNILGEFFESRLTCNQFKRSLLEDDVVIFKHCLDYAEEKHLLTPQHIDLLINEDKNVSKFFSIEDIKIRDIELVLTQYASESVEEFFAEAFALHACGKILPKKLKSLMDSTLTNAANFVLQED